MSSAVLKLATRRVFTPQRVAQGMVEPDSPPRAPRYLDIITSSFVAVLLISNVVGLKVFRVAGLIFDGGALIFPISYIFGDVLTEVYGYKACKRVIWQGFFWLVIFNLLLFACKLLPAEPSWDDGRREAAFQLFFENSGRLVAAGILGFFWGEFANSFVMAKLKIYTNGKHLWTRTIGSTLVGELIDTALFCIVAFAGILPVSELVNYTMTGYVYKTLVEVIMTPITYKVVAFLKREEGQDAYDRDTNFNPFHLEPA